MRNPMLALAALLAAAGFVPAQTNPPGKAAPATPPQDPAAAARLDAHLQRWEEAMRKVQTLDAEITREDKDKTFGTRTKFFGAAKYMKSGAGPTALDLATLELKQEGKADLADKFVCTGTYLYKFEVASKEIRAYEMPKPKPGQVADDSFLGFLFGMKAEAAKRRYVLNFASLKTAPNGEDTHYVYVDVLPRFPEDKAEFARARLVLNKDSYLPRQLWFEHANGSDTLWDVPKIQAGVTLDRRIFDAPKVPPDWKFVPVPKGTAASNGTGDVPPRVIRPQK